MSDEQQQIKLLDNRLKKTQERIGELEREFNKTDDAFITTMGGANIQIAELKVDNTLRSQETTKLMEKHAELKNSFDCHFRADTNYDLKYQKKFEELESVLKAIGKEFINLMNDKITHDSARLHEITAKENIEKALQTLSSKIENKIEYIASLNDPKAFEAINLGILKRERKNSGIIIPLKDFKKIITFLGIYTNNHKHSEECGFEARQLVLKYKDCGNEKESDPHGDCSNCDWNKLDIKKPCDECHDFDKWKAIPETEETKATYQDGYRFGIAMGNIQARALIKEFWDDLECKKYRLALGYRLYLDDLKIKWKERVKK